MDLSMEESAALLVSLLLFHTMDLKEGKGAAAFQFSDLPASAKLSHHQSEPKFEYLASRVDSLF